MKLIEQVNIDRKRWDKLVKSDQNSSIYCQSIFLDELAENWMLLVDDEYTVGLPIPYTVRLGVHGIYTPNFIRTIDWVGLNLNNSEQIIQQAESILKERFSLCQLKMLRSSFSGMKSNYVFQELSENNKLNSQAKRSLKKFQKSDLQIKTDQLNNIISIVAEELTNKVSSVKSRDTNRFESLFKNYPSDCLWTISVSDKNNVLGGLIFIRWKETLHYVKGGVRSSAKNQGAMYAMMDFAISRAISNNLKVDFGGSNVSGVKQFNYSFGATDVPYFEWAWDKSSFWFRWLKSLKNRKV